MGHGTIRSTVDVVQEPTGYSRVKKKYPHLLVCKLNSFTLQRKVPFRASLLYLDTLVTSHRCRREPNSPSDPAAQPQRIPNNYTAAPFWLPKEGATVVPGMAPYHVIQYITTYNAHHVCTYSIIIKQSFHCVSVPPPFVIYTITD